jgi:plastocyanin
MRKLALVLVALLLVTATGCGGSGDDNGSTAGCVDLSTRGSAFTIRLSGLQFHPSCFTASASQNLTVVNEDSTLHSFTIEGTPIDIDVEGGQTLHLDPVAGRVEPGTYELICKYHLPSMTGQITIVP